VGMMKALLWIAVGIIIAMIWTSKDGEKFVDDVSETYCSKYIVSPPVEKKIIK